MALNAKTLAKDLAFAANTGTVVFAALQSSGLLAHLSPTVNAVVMGLIAVLNAIVHAIPTPPADTVAK